MFLEKLEKIYYNYLMNDFDEVVVYQLNKFVIDNAKKGNKYISPYEFSYYSGLSIKQTIILFLYLLDDDVRGRGLFEIIKFINCPSPNCVDERLLIKGLDEFILCEECGKEYYGQEVIPLVKTYFKLKKDISLESPKNNNDMNSTYNILKGLDNDLKLKSPSSFHNENTDKATDGGDGSVKLTKLVNINDKEGTKISSEVDPFNTIFQSLDI